MRVVFYTLLLLALSVAFLPKADASRTTHDFSNGLLTARTSPFRSVAVQTRDALGRITDLRTTVGGVLALKETVPVWNALDKVQGVYATRAGTGAWNENRDYLYDNSGRLIYEDYVPYAAFGEDYTLTTYDGAAWGASATGGIGVRAYTQRWSDGVNLHAVPGVATFARVTSEQVGGSQARAVPLSGAALGAKSVALSLDGRAAVISGAGTATAWLPGGVTFPGWQDTQGLWSATGLLAPGYHALTATATHPSGWVAAPAASSFYVQPRAETVTNTYDEMGNVASRSWSLGKAQTLTWDGRGRLVKVVQTGVTPFTWTALYDGLNRRVSTTYTPNSGATVTTSLVFDPEVEFLEIGLAINGAWNWKVYGPDISGSYGGLQGLGGLEAVIGSDGVTRGIVNDWFGNAVGHVAAPGGAVAWSPAQFLAWGPAPGWGTPPIDGTKPLHELLGYRGLTLDPPGYVQMGLRPYDPQTGRWLSPDPLGHAGSLSLYDYCDNDPLNVYDPDGRRGTTASQPGLGSQSIRSVVDDTFNQLGFVGTVGRWIGLDNALNSSLTTADANMTASATAGNGRTLTTSQYINGIAEGTAPAARIAVGAAAVGAAPPVYAWAAANPGAVVTGTTVTAALAGVEGPNIALGLRGGLRPFAEQLKATHLLDNPAWKAELQAAMKNPNATFRFKLDGMSGGASVTDKVKSSLKAVRENWGGATDTELHMLNESGLLPKVLFYENGKLVPNPF